ncbi:uncharacterized protein LOC111379318 [Olea europaea var. sylvestris]|uniref:uncharacterized protein LOC111379318 n=1 Tax=Olea europaea var. sylvestris TaxID=158386 RepID=UPI000C1D6826|nr:uncharacterized protein LOC111379318 [Olea europaea var. sylvestris]
MPIYVKFMKEVMLKKRKLEEYEMMKLTEECSVILQKKLSQKRKNPGSFPIPCTIGDSSFDKSLYDLGVSLNLMPLSIFKKLGRSFLATGGALIDVQGGQLTLIVNEEDMKFNIYQAMQFPDDTNTCHRIDFIDVVVKEEEY